MGELIKTLSTDDFSKLSGWPRENLIDGFYAFTPGYEDMAHGITPEDALNNFLTPRGK